MHPASYANRTCSEFRSASEYTATVGIPSSLQAQMTRRAISPRLATRIFWNIGQARRLPLAAWANPEQRLAILHRLSVLRKDPQHFSPDFILDLIHQFHCFHYAQPLPLTHSCPAPHNTFRPHPCPP